MQAITTIVLFRNFTSEDFVGQWDGVSETIKAGQSRHMELFRAMHYGKHLVNRELLKANMQQFTSPKFPEQVPQYMELLKQCVIKDEEVQVHQSSAVEEMANLNQAEAPAAIEEPSEEEKFEGLEESVEEAPVEEKPVKKTSKKKE